MKPNALLLDPSDNVVTALEPVPAGGCILWAEDRRLSVKEEIPRGHKVAVEAIAAGEAIRKYGHPIGAAREAIAAGEHVHTHNLAAPEGW